MMREPDAKPLACIFANGERWRVHRLPFFGIRVFHGSHVEWPILTHAGFKWAKYAWDGDSSGPDPIPDVITDLVKSLLL